MKNIFICTVFLVALFFGCDIFDSHNDIHLSHQFNDLRTYKFSDFNIPGDYSYLEIRRKFDVPENQQLIFSFDKGIADTLSNEQLKAIKEANPRQGFTYQCLPAGCPIYGVALLDHSTSVNLLTTKKKLFTFLGDIDTEANLHLWLWAHDYIKSISYERQQSGYRAVVKWDNFCGKRGKDLVFISKKGKITRIKRLSTQKYKGCA